MSDIGVKVRTMPEGAAAYQKLIQGGFSAQEAENWKAQQNAKLQSGGFTGQEIAHYWGEGDPNFDKLDQHVGNNVGAAVSEEPKVASNPLEMLAAGWDMSVSGLALKGLPKTVAPQDAGLLGKIAFGAAQLAGDLPAVVTGLIGGAVAGGAAGAAVPVAGETGASEAVGGLAGAGFGSAFLPEAMRGVLTDHYEHPEGVLTFKDFMARSSAVAYNAGKAGVIGMVAAPVGGAVGGKVLAATARPAAAALADMTSYTVTATAMGGLMDGKVPDATDFAAGAAMMLGFHVGAKVSGPAFQRVQQNMRDIYRRSGVTPGEQMQRSQTDASYKQTILSRSPDNEPMPPPGAPAEPLPFKANALKVAAEHNEQMTDILSAAHAKANLRPLSRDESIDLVRRLENSGDKAVSPKGAVGRYQITPDTARTYGLDVNRLTDPKYSEAAAEKIIGALSGHYKNADGSTDMEAVLIAYNAGPGRANAYIRGGRDRTKLPLETQRYLEHADRLGGLNDKFGVELPKQEEKPVLSPEDRKEKIASIKSLMEQVNTLADKNPDGLNASQAQRYTSLMRQINGLHFDISRPLTARKVGDAASRMSTLEPETVIAAHDDLIRDRNIYNAIADAASGVNYNADTAVDIIMNGKNPDISPQQFYDNFSGTRDALRAQYGDVVTLFRAEGKQKSKATKNWATTKEYAEQFGSNIVSKQVSVDDIIAVNTGTKGKYHEVIVGKAPAKKSVETAGGSGEPPGPITPEELVAKAQGVIANPVEASLSQKLADQKKRFVFDAISELAPAERIDRAIGTPEDEFGIADAFRQTYGSAGRAWHRVTVGGLERDGEAYVKNDAPPLMSIYDSAKAKGGKEGIKELTAVRLAARTMELQGRGLKTPMKVEDATEIMKTLGPKYKEELAAARAANDAKIDDYVSAGMMSKENADKMKADNRDWFPHITEQAGTVASRKGGRFGPVQVVKKVKGHESQILDPRTQEIKSFYAMAAAADKNRATTALMQALKKEELSNWGIELKETGEAAHKEADDIMQAIVDGSIEGKAKLADNQFAYFVDGKRHVYQAEDPQIAQMIRGLSPINPDQTLAAFRWFAKIKRSGITDMPDFIARAMAKDAGGAAILSKWGGLPFVNTVRGLFHLSKADPVFQDFVANGGLGAALTDMDAQWITRDLHRMDTDAGFFAATINTVKHPLEAAQLVMQRMDAATRIGVKLNAESQGLTPLKAATEARKATLDFSEKAGSQSLNLLAGIVPFYRPSILGLKQMQQAFTDRPGTTALKASVYIAMPTAILYAMNYMQDQTLPEGQRFEDLPRWQKDTMFVLPAINGVRLRLPMPPVLGTLVGGLTNRALDHFLKSDPRAFKDWAGTMLAQFVPPVIPAAIAPIFEHMANYNSFQNAPLIPHSLEDASGYEQFLPSTSEAGKKVASILGPPGLNLVNVSPIVLDNYVRQWTGGLGGAILKATNGAFNPGKPSELADNAFIGSFFARTPALSSKDITDFYDGLDKVKTAHKDFSLAVERGDISDIDLTSKNAQAFLNLSQINEALKQQRAAVNAITHDEKMTQNEKRQFIDDIASGMVQTAKGGLKVLEAVDGK